METNTEEINKIKSEFWKRSKLIKHLTRLIYGIE